MTLYDGAGRRSGTSPALRLRGVSKTFDGVTVLKEVSFDVTRGRIHALVGGNGSGKSTTLKILAGVYQADAGGTLSVRGREFDAHRFDASASHQAGLRFVHQDLGLIDDLTISENFALVAGFPRAGAAIAWSRLHRRTAGALEAARLDLDPRARVGTLQPSTKTLVAIARAMADDLPASETTLILDEPTASLPKHEVDLLLDALDDRRNQGTTIVYVSHRIPEILSLADDVTVLRDGSLVHEGVVAGLTEADLVSLVTGVPEVEPTVIERREHSRGTPVFELLDRDRAHLGLVGHAGEIVGIAGMLGSGRSRLLRSIAGCGSAVRSEIRVDGAPRRVESVEQAIEAGIVYVSEDRIRESSFIDRPLWENVSSIVMPRFATLWGMRNRREQMEAVSRAARFGVKAPHGSVLFSQLSGGNQQKAIIARATWPNPRVLLLDEPTQGVDAAARREIHEYVRGHVRAGNTAIVVSSDYVELATLCDRVLVLQDGELRGEITAEDLSEGSIARAVLTAERRLAA